MTTRAEHLEYIGKLAQIPVKNLSAADVLSHCMALVADLEKDDAEVPVSDFEIIGAEGRKAAMAAYIVVLVEALKS